MRRNPNWTTREDATASVLRRAGMSPALIGERLNRTVPAVKRRLYWISLTGDRRSEVGRTKTRNRAEASA